MFAKLLTVALVGVSSIGMFVSTASAAVRPTDDKGHYLVPLSVVTPSATREATAAAPVAAPIAAPEAAKKHTAACCSNDKGRVEPAFVNGWKPCMRCAM